MTFEKWQALGNDYLILERDELAFELTSALVRALCDRHCGVGADGVLLLSKPRDRADVADLRIFNPDGSEAELSGNGAREALLYLRRRGWTERDSFSIHTAAGRIETLITGEFECRVDMGHARLQSGDFPGGPPDGRGELHAAAERDERVWHFQHVSIGNPQCAIAVADLEELEQLDLPAVGPGVEGHAAFPHRTNVSWYAELDPGPPARIRARIFERGVGETRASGTGACGAAIAYLLASRADFTQEPARPAHVTVVLDGGELEVQIDAGLGVQLSGWALPVFDGRLDDQQLNALRGGAAASDAARG
jgi:diaminopimelate epimerase